MAKGKIRFTGSFGEFFLISLGLMLLSLITLGLALPYFVYWQFKYFVSNLEIELYSNRAAEH